MQTGRINKNENVLVAMRSTKQWQKCQVKILFYLKKIGINFRISAVSFCVFIYAETCLGSIYTFTGINCFDCVVLDIYAESLSEDGRNAALQCITEHPSFNTVCLRREVLETAIVGLSQARGTRAPRETNNM